MNKRKVVLSLLMLSLLSVACLSPLSIANSKKEKVTLVLIHCWAGKEFEAFKPILEEAERELGIRIKPILIRTPELIPILDSMLPANETPGDVITVWWVWAIRKWAEKGYLMDVTDIYKDQPFLPGVADRYKVNGKIYAVVWTQKPFPLFFYRKSMFKKYNLSPPRTWDEFLLLLERAKKIPGIKAPIVCGDTSWPITLYSLFEAAILTYGGYSLHHDILIGKLKFTSPIVKEALKKYFIPLLNYMSDPVDWVSAIDLWWKGEYLIYPLGAWIYSMVPDPDDVGFFFYPGQNATMTSTDGWFVPKATKHPKEALALLRFLASKRAQMLQVKQGGHWALRTDIPLEAYPAYARPLAEALRKMSIASPLDASISGKFSTTFERYVMLLKAQPEKLDEVLSILEGARK